VLFLTTFSKLTMKPEIKKIVSIVLTGLCALRIILHVLDYFLQKKNLDNPLIPGSLIVKLGYICAFMCAMYGFVILLNAIYLWQRRFFNAIVIASLVIILAINIFRLQIDNYILSIN